MRQRTCASTSEKKQVMSDIHVQIRGELKKIPLTVEALPLVNELVIERNEHIAKVAELQKRIEELEKYAQDEMANRIIDEIKLEENLKHWARVLPGLFVEMQGRIKGEDNWNKMELLNTVGRQMRDMLEEMK